VKSPRRAAPGQTIASAIAFTHPGEHRRVQACQQPQRLREEAARLRASKPQCAGTALELELNLLWGRRGRSVLRGRRRSRSCPGPLGRSFTLFVRRSGRIVRRGWCRVRRGHGWRRDWGRRAGVRVTFAEFEAQLEAHRKGMLAARWPHTKRTLLDHQFNPSAHRCVPSPRQTASKARSGALMLENPGLGLIWEFFVPLKRACTGSSSKVGPLTRAGTHAAGAVHARRPDMSRTRLRGWWDVAAPVDKRLNSAPACRRKRGCSASHTKNHARAQATAPCGRRVVCTRAATGAAGGTAGATCGSVAKAAACARATWASGALASRTCGTPPPVCVRSARQPLAAHFVFVKLNS